MKIVRRLFFGWLWGIVALLTVSTIALAVVPSDMLQMTVLPSDTTINLTWTPATGAATTIIRYKTTGFPANPTIDGTLTYNGTATQTQITGLTAGQTYYISAWGYNGSGYSVNALQRLTNTYSVALPSGGQINPVPVIPIPTIPANANQSASATGFNLSPITDLINWMNNAPGGLGMPSDNLWGTLAIAGIVTVSSVTYIKIKNFFIAYFVLLAAACFAVALHLTQGYLVGIEIVIGAGVWALERFFQ